MPTYSYNTSNELTSNSSGSYTYDANGNTLSDASGKSYTWDFENRLVSAVVPGTGTVSFKYDPFGRRIYKSSPTFTGIFVYDGPNLIETANSSGAEIAGYTQDRDIDSPLSELRGGTTSYYEADETLGSITSLSNSAGALANTYTYDSFGNLTASTGTLTNPFRYTGREFDSETGLYFYRARYLDPATGRFITEDPLRFGGGTDFYPYADDSPVNEIDPLGLTAGPKNPRAGTRCRPTDSCSQLRGKIFLLEQTISSHQGWDWTMGWPRGGGRHSQEIADFWNALARCFNIYEKNCKNKENCDKGEGFPDPQPTPQPNPPINLVPIPIDPIVPPMPMPEPFPEPIFPLEPVFPF